MLTQLKMASIVVVRKKKEKGKQMIEEIEQRGMTACEFIDDYVKDRLMVDVLGTFNVFDDVTIQSPVVKSIYIRRVHFGILKIELCPKLQVISINCCRAVRIVFSECKPEKIEIIASQPDTLKFYMVEADTVNLNHVSVKQDVDLASLTVTNSFRLIQSDFEEVLLSDNGSGMLSTFKSPAVITDNRKAIVQFHLAGIRVYAPTVLADRIAQGVFK